MKACVEMNWLAFKVLQRLFGCNLVHTYQGVNTIELNGVYLGRHAQIVLIGCNPLHTYNTVSSPVVSKTNV